MAESHPKPSDDSIDHVLAEYLRRVKRDELVDREQFIAEHPQAAGRLRAYFDENDAVRAAADGTVARPEATPADSAQSPQPAESEGPITYAQGLSAFETSGAAPKPVAGIGGLPSSSSADALPGIEQVAAFLGSSGLLRPDQVDELLSRASAEGDGTDVAGLLDELHQAGRLTVFQCEALRRGRAAELVLGTYVLMDRLGRGGMGQVYRAWHRNMDRMVALKTLRPETIQSDTAVARFHREVRTAARLAHPNIVTAYDADESNGVHFLVMELVAGQDLAAHVRAHGPASVAEAADWVLQAARGLAHAHHQGIVHRDVKAGNLLLGTDGTVKVLDMGLARLEERLAGDRGSLADGLTQTGDVLGTLDYMAPEQIVDTRRVGTAADVYSLGCTLHFLLMGQPPYGGRTVSEKLLSHRKHPIPSLRAARADVPEPLDRLFQRMLAKRQEDRPTDMSEVIAGLAPFASPADDVADATQTCKVAPLAEAARRTATEPSPWARPIATRLRRPKHGLPWPAWDGWRNPRVMAVAGAAFAGILLLAVAVGMLRSDKGTLVVEVDEPGATVEVFDEEETMVVRGVADTDPLKFSIDPGKHRIRVEKEGFEFFSQDFSIARRGREVLRARLEPVGGEGTETQEMPIPKADVQEASVAKAPSGTKLPDGVESPDPEIVSEVSREPEDEAAANEPARKISELEKKLAETPDGTFDWGLHNELRHWYGAVDQDKSMSHIDIILQNRLFCGYMERCLGGWNEDEARAVSALVTVATEYADLRHLSATCWIWASELESDAAKAREYVDQAFAVKGTNERWRQAAKERLQQAEDKGNAAESGPDRRAAKWGLRTGGRDSDRQGD